MISLQFDSVFNDDINSKVEILSALFYNPEIIIRKEKVWHFSDPDTPLTMDLVYSKSGKYIGGLEFLKNFSELTSLKDIQPTDTMGNTCSIGFCETENSWYGWSHRACASFTIGSSVKHGDCAYTPNDLEDKINCAIEFFDLNGRIFEIGNEDHDSEPLRNTSYKSQHTSTDVLEKEYVLNYIFTRFNSEGEIFELENKSMTFPIPESYGRGEWTALTLEDAKQMAIDYARGVS